MSTISQIYISDPYNNILNTICNPQPGYYFSMAGIFLRILSVLYPLYTNILIAK